MLNKSLSIAAAAALFASTLSAQGDRATLTGTVTDPSGAVVAGAKVRAVHVQTNTERETVASNQGEYTLLQLPVGEYRVEFSAAGFKELVRSGVVLNVGVNARLDGQLQVGAVSESVTVSGQAGLLQTESARSTTSVTPKFVQDLPLVVGGQLRSPLDLVLIAPEAKSTYNISLGGGMEGGWDLTVDGVSATPAAPFEQRLWTMVNSPSVEAVNEFSVDTNGFKAEYGHAGGGSFTFVSKSGTNQYHGNAYEFARNEKFDANTFFFNATGRKRPVRKQHDFGATFGGPVWIPKFYRGRDRTFFFFSWEAFRDRSVPSFAPTTIPLAEMYGGDFSNWKTQTGALIPIFDPATTAAEQGGRFTRMPFAGNRIPTGRFSTVARNVIPFATMRPNVGDPTGVLNPNPRLNFQPAGARTDPWDKYSIKVDHQLRPSQRLGFLYQKNRTQQLPVGDPPGLPLPINNEFQYGDTYTNVFRLSHDWTVRPTIVNRLSAGGNDWGQVRRAHDAQFNQGWGTKLGIKNVPDANLLFPAFNFDGYRTFGRAEYGGSYNKTVAFTDDVSIVRGGHTFKAGYTYQRDHYNGYGQHTGSGAFNFSRQTTGIPGSQDPNSGNGFATFLLGIYNSASIETQRYVSDQWTYHGMYFQDDWRVNKKLTLNLGVRYEYIPPTVEGNFPDGYSNFDPNLPNPGAGGRLGAMVFAGNGPGRTGTRTLYNPWRKGIGPRFGLAYSANDKTVVRLSAGRSYASVKNTGGSSHFHGFIGADNIVWTDQNQPSPYLLDNGYRTDWPRPPFLVPTFNNNNNTPFWQSFDSGRMPDYTSWNLNVQRQLPGEMVVEIGYNAMMGHHLTTNLVNINQVPTAVWDDYVRRLGPAGAFNLFNSRWDSPLAVANGITRPYPTFNDTVRQALRPYPQYQTINTGGDGGDRSGNSTYHALVVKWEKRTSKGLTFLNSYVFSKLLTDSESMNADSGGSMDHYNRRLEKALSRSDQTHNLKFSYSYELPFGKGKRFLSSGAAGKVIGGWRIAGIQTYASGFPMGLGPGYALPLFSNGSNRVTVMSYDGWRGGVSGKEFDPNKDLWWNPQAFSPTVLDALPPGSQFKGVALRGNFGNATRRNPKTRQPWFLNESVSVVRTFTIKEGIQLDMRFEAFNAFNRIRWGGPDSTINSNTFGRVTTEGNTPRQIQLGAKFIF